MSASRKIARWGVAVACLLAVGAGVLLLELHTMMVIPSARIPESTAKDIPPELQPPVAEAQRIIAPLLKIYPGLSVAVGLGDSVAWSQGFGYADLEQRKAAAAGTRFRAYSVAKTITGTAILQMCEHGSIALDNSIGSYIPELPPEVAQVTIRQLAGHLSGIRDYRQGEWLPLSSGSCATPMQALGAFINDPLAAPRGSTFQYSSFNYVLLSAVIETVSGVPFANHMATAILELAGMDSTFYVGDEASGRATAVFYEPGWMGRVRVAREVDNSCKFGAGALITTAEDLVRFGNALLAGDLLDASMVATAFTGMTTAAGEETHYGLGWGIGTDEEGRRYAAHSGGAIGGRAAILVYPSERVVVALMANIEGERLTDAAARIAHLFLADQDGGA